MSKRISSEELVRTGFVNKIFETERDEEGAFLGEVLREVEERLGGHLNQESLLLVKELIRRPERGVLDRQTVAEVFGGLDRFTKGVPQEEFRRVAGGEKRHKL